MAFKRIKDYEQRTTRRSTIEPEDIKSRVTVQEILEHYGYSTGKKGRCPCPIHNGKDNNFSYNEQFYHCFVCGAKGDVISLVMELEQIGFVEAKERINSDFGLGLAYDIPAPAARQIARQHAITRYQKKNNVEDSEQQLKLLATQIRSLREQEDRLRPKSMDEDPDPEFFKTIERREYLEYTYEKRLAERSTR